MSLRRLIRRAIDDYDPPVIISQPDGSDARFRQSDLTEAYLDLVDRARTIAADEEPPPEHPLNTAARLSPDPHWQQPMHATGLADVLTEDLSER